MDRRRPLRPPYVPRFSPVPRYRPVAGLARRRRTASGGAGPRITAPASRRTPWPRCRPRRQP